MTGKTKRTEAEGEKTGGCKELRPQSNSLNLSLSESERGNMTSAERAGQESEPLKQKQRGGEHTRMHAVPRAAGPRTLTRAQHFPLLHHQHLTCVSSERTNCACRSAHRCLLWRWGFDFEEQNILYAPRVSRERAVSANKVPSTSLTPRVSADLAF